MGPIAIAYLLLLFVGYRIVVFHIDRSNISSAARQKGIRNATITWAPFAPGWLFERSKRSYSVHFLDDDGKDRVRYCQISLLTGIYWRD